MSTATAQTEPAVTVGVKRPVLDELDLSLLPSPSRSKS